MARSSGFGSLFPATLPLKLRGSDCRPGGTASHRVGQSSPDAQSARRLFELRPAYVPTHRSKPLQQRLQPPFLV